MHVPTTAAAGVQDFIPSVCTESPEPGMALCQVHCVMVKELGYLTNLREFLKSCDQRVDPTHYTKEMEKMVTMKLKEISEQINSGREQVKSSTDVQGKRRNNLLTLILMGFLIGPPHNGAASSH